MTDSIGENQSLSLLLKMIKGKILIKSSDHNFNLGADFYIYSMHTLIT